MAKYSGESSTAAPVHQPFIKMTSPISLVKLNQVILKLQSFHEEKIQAREKADEFFSQFRQRYKPKSCPYLRPTLKKFKKVRNKYHNDKQREASYQFLAFNHYYQQQGYFLILLAFWVLHSLYLMCKSRISQIMDFQIRFDMGFILVAKQMLILAEVVGVRLGHNMFDELPHSTNTSVL
nr:uncharacterized protein LOC103400830 isoform X2 [Malus domestica]